LPDNQNTKQAGYEKKRKKKERKKEKARTNKKNNERVAKRKRAGETIAEKQFANVKTVVGLVCAVLQKSFVGKTLVSMSKLFTVWLYILMHEFLESADGEQTIRG
jgi:hypothetical protein